MQLSEMLQEYQNHYERSIQGRRITLEHIQPLIKKLPEKTFKKSIAGYSEKQKPIYIIGFGSGSKKILIWTQMHGDESTGTKAVFDLLSILNNLNTYKNKFTNVKILFVTMLNPDGAFLFTRLNYKNVDLNRDAVDIKAAESKVLRKVIDEFKPDFCFNLHDQRSIFNVQGSQNPAILSFLAPSEDKEKTLTEGRKQTMSVIVAMNRVVSQCIPNHIGRYTDAFYPTATGDNFQRLGYNTILIEAGHYPNDYSREQVRKFNCIALLTGILFIAGTDDFSNYEPYFDIPNNDTLFYDVLFTNVNYKNKIQDIAFQYHFKVVADKLTYYLKKVNQGDLSKYLAHYTLDMKTQELPDDFQRLIPKIKI